MPQQRTPNPVLRKRGSRHADKRDEPEPDPECPEPPEWLTDRAADLFSDVARNLYGLGVMTALDRETLAVMCDAWDRFLTAREAVADEGLTVDGRSGATKRNPKLMVMNQAAERFEKLASKFGLNPVDRTRLESRPDNEQDSGSYVKTSFD